MAVDFRFRRAPMYRVAALRWKGPWNEAKIRANFRRLARWCAANGGRAGVWFFREPGERQWEVLIQVGASARSDGPIRVRTLPATRVASVVFDPNVVEARVIYHGLNDWLRWRRKDGEIRRVGSFREVYLADPWSDPKAWARTEIQVEVR